MKYPVWFGFFALLILSSCKQKDTEAAKSLQQILPLITHYSDWGEEDSALAELLPTWKATQNQAEKEVLANLLVRTYLSSDTPAPAAGWIDSLKGCQVPEAPFSALTANTLGSWFQSKGLKDSAAVYFRVATLAKGAYFPGENARAWMSLGVIFHSSKPDSALIYYEKGRSDPDLSLPGMAVLEAKINNNLGSLYLRQRANYEAEAAYSRALRRLSGSFPPDFPYLLRTRLYLGYVLSDLLRYDEAIEQMQAALDGYQSNPQTEQADLAACYVRLASAWAGKGDLDRSLDFFDQAIAIYRSLSASQPVAQKRLAEALNNRALTCDNYQRYSEALNNLRESAALYAAFGQGEQTVAAILATNQAHISMEIGQLDSAAKYFTLTQNLLEKLRASGISSQALPVYFHLFSEGEFHFKKKEYPLASSFYQQAIAEANTILGRKAKYAAESMFSLSKNFWAMGLRTAAFDMLKQAISVQVKEGNPVDSFGNPVLSGAIAPRQLLESLWQKASWEQQDTTLSPEKRLAQSLATYRCAAALSDSLELGIGTEGAKFFWLAQADKRYHEAFSTAWKRYQITGSKADAEMAFFFAEKGKAALLREAWQESEAKAFAGIPAPLLRLEKRILADMSYAERQLSESEEGEKATWQLRIFSNRARYDSLLRVFESNFPAYHKLKYQVAVPSLAAVQASLPEGATLLEYVTGDSGVFVMGLSAKAVFFQKLPVTEEALAYTVQYWRKLMLPGKAVEDSAASIGNTLYRQVMAPIANKLTPRILIAADGPLGLLPFEALVTQAVAPGADPSTWPFVLNTYACSYVFAASLLEEMQTSGRNHAPGKSMLAVAPTFDGNKENVQPERGGERDQLMPLAYNQQEATAVANLFGGKTLMDDQASRARFLALAPDYRIIHLSSHGVIHDKDSRFSYIAFARTAANEPYGKLFVADLYNLDLPAEMVVLSACETGVGEWKRGEGIISLARGFSYAGAQSIVTTLWGVNDYLTAELMNVFYENLKSGMPKDEALQAAKRTLVQQGWGPYYWAAPIVVGDLKPVSDNSFPWLKVAGGIALILSLLLAGYYLFQRMRNVKAAGKY